MCQTIVSRGVPSTNYGQTGSSTFGMLSVLYFGLQGDCECFTNLFDVPNAWNNMKHTPLHSFILVLSLKGTLAGNEFFDWLIIPLPLPIPFILFLRGSDGSGRKRNSSDPFDSDSVELRLRFLFLIYTGS